MDTAQLNFGGIIHLLDGSTVFQSQFTELERRSVVIQDPLLDQRIFKLTAPTDLKIVKMYLNYRSEMIINTQK